MTLLFQNFTDQEFFNLFSTVGKCNKARIIRHRQTGYSYGYGFIDMGSAADAEKAIKKLNQYQIGHKRLKVAYSLPSGERTRNINLYIKVSTHFAVLFHRLHTTTIAIILASN